MAVGAGLQLRRAARSAGLAAALLAIRHAAAAGCWRWRWRSRCALPPAQQADRGGLRGAAHGVERLRAGRAHGRRRRLRGRAGDAVDAARHGQRCRWLAAWRCGLASDSAAAPAPSRCARAPARSARVARALQRPRDRRVAARRAAHCPAPPPGCAASARGRCGGSRCLRCGAGTRLRSSATAPAASAPSRPSRASKSGSAAALRVLVPGADELAVVAAVDAVADQRRAARAGSARRARSSGRRCSAARRAGTAPTMACVGQTSMQALQLPQCALDRRRSAAAPGRRRSRRGRTSSRPRGAAPACACRASRCRCARPARPRAPAPNR